MIIISGNNKTQSHLKSVSLSKILSLKFHSEAFLEEFLIKFNQDDNLMLIKNSIGVNNCNDIIINTILFLKRKRWSIKLGCLRINLIQL